MNAYEAGKVLLLNCYTAYTPDFKAAAKKRKRYGTEPRVGAVIEYYVQSKGRIGHTGIVVRAEFSNGCWDFDTVEGNSNNEVRLIHHNLTPGQIGNGNHVDGFMYPDFKAETCSAEQFIAMARSQVGYKEKRSNSQLESFTANAGSSNYTKYNQWAAECGFGYQPSEWCAQFVSWVAYMACETAHDYVAGWVQQDNGSWSYRKKDGQLAADEWIHDGGRWYVFDGSCRMITGWYKDSTGLWYYLAGDGGMCASQWVMDGGKSYYLTNTGAMAVNAYVRAVKPVAEGIYIYYWVDEKGVYQPQWDTAHPHLETYDLAF